MPPEARLAVLAGLLGSLSSVMRHVPRWLLLQIFVSGLPTCDGVRVHRRDAAQRLSALIESTGTAGTLFCSACLGQLRMCSTLQGQEKVLHFPQGGTGCCLPHGRLCVLLTDCSMPVLPAPWLQSRMQKSTTAMNGETRHM